MVLGHNEALNRRGLRCTIAAFILLGGITIVGLVRPDLQAPVGANPVTGFPRRAFGLAGAAQPISMTVFGTDVRKDDIVVFEPGVTKREALERLVQAVAQSAHIENEEGLLHAVREREAVMSTGIGSGVAIPHVRISDVKRPCVGVGVSAEGIDYDTLDNEPVHVLVLFAMPAGAHREYLRLLAQVMTALKTPGFRDRLAACSNADEVYEALQCEEAEAGEKGA